MDIDLDTHDKKVTKIEDIIDIQKANGNIRQVAFKLPSEKNSNVSINLGKSLETGLSKVKAEQNKKKEKLRQKYQRDSDVISWPSDSDITVLRMKLCTNDIKSKTDNVALGDGLHQLHSSSMVNLATLMLQSQRPSKHSIDEEYLMPLTSWEKTLGSSVLSKNKTKSIIQANPDTSDLRSSGSICTENNGAFPDISETSIKSKVAMFLRLYFCPCCSCLYNLEQIDGDTRKDRDAKHSASFARIS
ncbi:uncharacterized protein LOC123668304 [Melitaea cinxia]|uniref:uncharacterized protein LOC123668304 n=1 Tax=Melitaea cinxia TaxID=113334 RepID=UPI001E273069|nr:uncharacterized protein LOC123668304 [Melitaea cinxia]